MNRSHVLDEKPRVAFVDIAKGIAILLMVVGHVFSLPTPLKHAIYSFHMPLFFMMSGYFARKENVRTLALRMMPMLIVPYMAVGGVIRVANIINNAQCGMPFDYVDLLSLLGVCWKFDGDMVSAGAIWFLVVLYWSKLYFQVVVSSKFGIPWMFILATMSIGVTKLLHIVIPFGVQQAFVCTIFLYMGYLCRKKNLFDVKMSNFVLMALIISVIPFLSKLGIGTRANNYTLGFMSILISSFLVWIIVLAVKRLEVANVKAFLFLSPFLAWCGRISLVILAVHSIETRLFPFKHSNFVIETTVRLAIILSLAWICTKIPATRRLFHVK